MYAEKDAYIADKYAREKCYEYREVNRGDDGTLQKIMVDNCGVSGTSQSISSGTPLRLREWMATS